MRRLRIAGLAMLALAVPPLAFGGEEEPAAPAALSVSASLGGCGLANAAVVCEIDTSWSALEGAEYYTVSVTRPDGSVADAGEVSGNGTSVFVPYVGPGTYSVEVAAWGTPPGAEQPEVLVREKALSTGSNAGGGARQEPDRSGLAGDDRGASEPADVTDEPVPATDPPVDEAPACDEPAEEPAEEPLPEVNGAPAPAAPTAPDELAPEAPATSDEPDARPVCR
jgi:hypothetical protein